jgi:hypothetical protein
MAFFSRVEKPSDDINSHLFLMNKKGLNIQYAKHFPKYYRNFILKVKNTCVGRMTGGTAIVFSKVYEFIYSHRVGFGR